MRKRLFTEDFELGDEVDVLRTRHGWYDGKLRARVTKIYPNTCEVTDTNDAVHEILHPRDLKRVR